MNNRIVLRLLLVVSFAACLYVNYISNAWPLNGFTAGELSDLYPNQFTPAGFTFAVWGVIYLASIAAVLALVFTTSEKVPQIWYSQITVINLMNMAWLFCWHYQNVFLSVLVMVMLLFTLIWTYITVRETDADNLAQRLVKVMTSFYLSWISVALVANITSFLVKNQVLTGNVVTESVIASVMLIIALIIAWWVTKKYNDFLHPLILAWASFGIYSKMSAQTESGNLAIVVVAIIVIVLSLLLSISNARRSLMYL